LNPNSNKNILKRLDLRFCTLKDTIVTKILSYLASKNFYALESLDLTFKDIRNETILVLNEKLNSLKGKM